MNDKKIEQAMVLAAGLGTRMRPITDRIPKPLVAVAGKTLLDHGLDALERAGVKRAACNAHYLADQIETHVAARALPKVAVSDERSELLDSGGGVKHALPLLDKGDLIVLNADSFWIDGKSANLEAMQSAWHPAEMDMLLLLSRKEDAVGFDGAGDFFMDDDGRLTRRGTADTAPFVFAGVYIAKSEHFEAVPEQKFSTIALFDQAIANERLFGILLDGLWLHVGTPAAIATAEEAISVFESSRA